MSHQKVTYMGMTPEEWYEKHKDSPGWELGPLPKMDIVQIHSPETNGLFEQKNHEDLKERNRFQLELMHLYLSRKNHDDDISP